MHFLTAQYEQKLKLKFRINFKQNRGQKKHSKIDVSNQKRRCVVRSCGFLETVQISHQSILLAAPLNLFLPNVLKGVHCQDSS